MKTDLNQADEQTLSRAALLERKFNAGIFPRDGGQASHFKRLERLGMLEFSGEYGRDIDGEVEREVPLWKLTDQGRRWAQERETISLLESLPSHAIVVISDAVYEAIYWQPSIAMARSFAQGIVTGAGHFGGSLRTNVIPEDIHEFREKEEAQVVKAVVAEIEQRVSSTPPKPITERQGPGQAGKREYLNRTRTENR